MFLQKVRQQKANYNISSKSQTVSIYVNHRVSMATDYKCFIGKIKHGILEDRRVHGLGQSWHSGNKYGSNVKLQWVAV